MGNIPEQYVYNDKVFMVGDSPNTLRPTGKYPLIANQEWSTLSDAISFINDPNSTAIPGMVITVVNDELDENNGVYFVKSVGYINEEGEHVLNGILRKIADDANVSGEFDELNSRVEQMKSDLEEEIIDAVKYKSGAGDNWLTEQLGGVAGGLSKDDVDISGKTVNEILDMLLYPTLQPEIIEPSVTLSYNGNDEDGEIICLNVGDNIPATSEFITTIKRGEVSYINSKSNNYYAGEGVGSFDIDRGGFGQPATEGVSIITYSVSFADGPQLLDNKGGLSTKSNFKSQTISKSKVVHVSYPIYINNENIGTLTSQGSLDYIGNDLTFIVDIPKETINDKFMLQVPSHLTVESIYQYNILTEDFDIDMRYMLNNKSEVTLNNIKYNSYKRTTDLKDFIGSSKYRITIKKKI